MSPFDVDDEPEPVLEVDKDTVLGRFHNGCVPHLTSPQKTGR